MKCKYCGYESRSSFVKCPGCHRSQSAAAPVYRLSVKKLIRLILFVIVIAAAVAVAVILLFPGSSFGSPKQSLVYREDSNGELVFVFDGKTAVRTGEELSGRALDVKACFSGRYAVILTEAGDLYLVSEKGVRKIDGADGVSSFVCAPFAEKILYIKKEPGMSGGVLFEYELSSSGSPRALAEGVYDEGSPLLYSPEGEAYSYVTDYNADTSTWTVNVAKSGSDEVEKYYGVQAQALSDSGEYLYYTDAAGNFYAGDELISEDGASEILFSCYNATAGEALFSVRRGNVCLLVLFSDGAAVSSPTDGIISGLIFPDYVFSADGLYASVESFVKSGVSMVEESYSGESVFSYYYISDKRLSLEKISPLSGTDLPQANGQLYMTDDGVTVYYRKADQTSIKYMEISDYNSAAHEIDTGVRAASFKVSPSGEYICLKGTDGRLYFYDGSQSVKISDSVYSDEYYVTDSGTVFFGTDYSGSGLNLYVCRKGKSALFVQGMSSGYTELTVCADDRVLVETEYGFYSVKNDSASLVAALDG